MSSIMDDCDCSPNQIDSCLCFLLLPSACMSTPNHHAPYIIACLNYSCARMHMIMSQLFIHHCLASLLYMHGYIQIKMVTSLDRYDHSHIHALAASSVFACM